MCALINACVLRFLTAVPNTILTPPQHHRTITPPRNLLLSNAILVITLPPSPLRRVVDIILACGATITLTLLLQFAMTYLALALLPFEEVGLLLISYFLTHLNSSWPWSLTTTYKNVFAPLLDSFLALCWGFIAPLYVCRYVWRLHQHHHHHRHHHHHH
jgi:hypothetical protein